MTDSISPADLRRLGNGTEVILRSPPVQFT
jgi:hypothetical protein